MNIPSEAYEVLFAVIIISLAMIFVSLFTRQGKNFRSRRNKKARRQDHPFDLDI